MVEAGAERRAGWSAEAGARGACEQNRSETLQNMKARETSSQRHRYRVIRQ